MSNHRFTNGPPAPASGPRHFTFHLAAKQFPRIDRINDPGERTAELLREALRITDDWAALETGSPLNRDAMDDVATMARHRALDSVEVNLNRPTNPNAIVVTVWFVFNHNDVTVQSEALPSPTKMWGLVPSMQARWKHLNFPLKVNWQTCTAKPVHRTRARVVTVPRPGVPGLLRTSNGNTIRLPLRNVKQMRGRGVRPDDLVEFTTTRDERGRMYAVNVEVVPSRRRAA